MAGESDKANENPYLPPRSSNDPSPGGDWDAIERWIGVIFLGIIVTIGIPVSVVVLVMMMGS